MSDERIEKALRQGPPAEPAYLVHLTRADLQGLITKAPRSKSAFNVLAGLGQAAVAAALLVAVVGVVLIRSGAFETAAKPSTRLADIQDRGVIRIAVRPDRPQVTAPSGARSGFDVDVATEIGRRLGLRVELNYIPAEEMLAGRGAWDIALPSSAVESGAFATTTPYYDWPVRLIVPEGSVASGPGDLSGSTICVVTGSSGEAWLDGQFRGTSVTPVAVPPTPSAVHKLATDEACAAELDAGASAALITAGWSDADLAARPALQRVGDAIFVEARPVIALRGEREPAGLIAEIDRILAAMRSDGTLADLSQSRFGGLDLSQPPTR
ncbi:MAG: transporter substrate-binding domain-containing protein [Candidatus Limnocylindrales bacterium]